MKNVKNSYVIKFAGEISEPSKTFHVVSKLYISFYTGYDKKQELLHNSFIKSSNIYNFSFFHKNIFYKMIEAEISE